MLFLEGRSKQLVAEFKRRMSEAAHELRYEEAARWRNLLHSIQVTVEKQKMVMQGGDSDVVGYFRDSTRLELALLFIRGGVLTGSRLVQPGLGVGRRRGRGRVPDPVLYRR